MPGESLPKKYYPLWWLLLGISRLPFPVLYFISDLLYLLVYKVIGYRKKVVRQNLENAFPEKSGSEISAITAAFYRNLCDIILETLKLATIRPEEMRKRLNFINPELAGQFVEHGKPAIILGSHLANWEWSLSSGAVNFSFPVDGVYKPLSDPFFDWFMRETRSRLGAHLIPMKDTLRDMIRRQKIPRLICMLSDQTPPKGEIQFWTTFLNQETGFYVGADKLATSFQYPVIFFGTRREKRGHYAFEFELLHDGKEVLQEGSFEITERFARTLEKWIRENPADYLWSHRRWKHKKPVTQQESSNRSTTF
jgi:KDO2-lipid IV(A) lauroyltransferase